MIGTLGRNQRKSLSRLLARSVSLLAICAGLSLTDRTTAGDWPQILGPQRNGQASSDERLAARWPAAGPPTRWQRNVGSGFSGIAVAGGKAILFHRIAKQQVIEALDPKSGKTLWKTGFATNYSPRFTPDNGPRCVPLIHKNHVYLFGAEGDLICLTLDTGRKVWHRTLNRDYQVTEGYFGAGSTPIIERDRLLVNVGGRNGSGIVAISLADGKTLWKATDERVSYSSPVATTIDGVRHVIFVTRLNVVSINAADGSTRFSYPFGKRGLTVTGASPVICGDRVFTSASYEIGSTMARIGKSSAKTVWESRQAMASQYSTSIYRAGYLYGIDGRADGGTARLKCLDAATGKVMWSEANYGIANLLFADGKLIISKDDGTLSLAKISPQGYQQLATAKVFENTTRALPALSDGLLYLRDSKTLKCFEVGDEDRKK